MKTVVRLAALLKAQEVIAEKECGLRIMEKNSFEFWSSSSGCKICTDL